MPIFCVYLKKIWLKAKIWIDRYVLFFIIYLNHVNNNVNYSNYLVISRFALLTVKTPMARNSTFRSCNYRYQVDPSPRPVRPQVNAAQADPSHVGPSQRQSGPLMLLANKLYIYVWLCCTPSKYCLMKHLAWFVVDHTLGIGTVGMLTSVWRAGKSFLCNVYI